jgi:hypothetical protein
MKNLKTFEQYSSINESIDISTLKKGDFLKKNGSNIEVEVKNIGRDGDHDFVELYNDVTDSTTKLVDLSNYELSKFNESVELSENNFYDTYKPQINHFERAKADDSIADEDVTGHSGTMYETYGEELEYVFELSKTTKRVWTIIEGDDDTMYYVAGFHRINRMGYLVCENEYETGNESVKLDTEINESDVQDPEYYEDSVVEMVSDWLNGEKNGNATEEEIKSEIDAFIGALEPNKQKGINKEDIFDRIDK